MVVFPNAKINLGLNILRKRQDNYHDIESLMIGVDWCDVLEIVPSLRQKDSLTCSGIYVDCPPEKNLVMKAVKKVREAGYSFPYVDVYLQKNIPDGAGLGGGSADATFAIRCLNDMFELGMTAENMANMASTIGSDCPFFIYNVPMLASGRGEKLSSVNIPSHNCFSDCLVVIIKPKNVSVSTAEAYSGTMPCIPQNRIEDILNRPIEDWQSCLVNDFEKTVFSLKPEIKFIKDLLIKIGAVYSSMSGSGSAVFGVFRNDFDATKLDIKIPHYCHIGHLIL